MSVNYIMFNYVSIVNKNCYNIPNTIYFFQYYLQISPYNLQYNKFYFIFFIVLVNTFTTLLQNVCTIIRFDKVLIIWIGKLPSGNIQLLTYI